jgi:lipopolysaccharide transport system permease protein
MENRLEQTICPIVHMLELEPAAAHGEWIAWSDVRNLDQLEGDAIVLLPLLSGRIVGWLAQSCVTKKQRATILGILKRGWACNQIAQKRLERTWRVLQDGGVHPIAVCGDSAWAQLYREEAAVRPITSLEVLVPRDEAALGAQLLQKDGWTIARDMPHPSGDALDHFEGVWFNFADGVSCCLRWRLMPVAPESARSTEKRLQGLRERSLISDLPTEELLLTALIRTGDNAVGWRCDAIVLLRNRSVDWVRFHRLSVNLPDVLKRLTILRDESGCSIPSSVTEPQKTSYLRRRITRVWVDYRRSAWVSKAKQSPRGFAQYMLTRFLQSPPARQHLTVIDASARHHGATWEEYKRYRTLFLFLALRDIQLRYKRTWRGILWAIVQPVLPMLIFAAIFAHVIRPGVRQGPYWLFVLAGFAPWLFFANGTNYASVSFTNNLNLITKVYFPRALIPAAAVTACLLDFTVTSVFIFVLCWAKGYTPGVHLLLLPAVLVMAASAAASASIAASSLNVLFRDLRPLIPFLVQVWMYATPVLYPVSLVPSRWQPFLWVNPMTGVIELFRSALFNSSPNWRGVGVSLFSIALLAIAALLLFRNLEADLAERA